MKLIQIIDEWRREIENTESQIDSPIAWQLTIILIDKNGAIEGNILNEESGQNKRTRKVEALRR